MIPEIINASLITPLSYVVRNPQGEIIAVRLTSVIHRPDVKKADNFSFESKNDRTWRMRPIQRLLHNLEEQVSVEVDEFPRLLIAYNI